MMSELEFYSVIQVFSAFGFVHKIATFEKAAGFQVGQLFITIWLVFLCHCFIHFICVLSWQALIQFSDADTAASARNALDGRSIPRQVVQFHPSS